jgi:thiamine kinase-like enzyme
MPRSPEDILRALPCWRGAISIAPLHGGLSNANFTVTDSSGAYVARLGRDFPFHHVNRRREAEVSRWAFGAGLSPEVIHSAEGVLVCRRIDGRAYQAEDVGRDLDRIVALIRRCHQDMSALAQGEANLFWVFHVLRDYARTLARHPGAGALPRMMEIARAMEAAQIPLPIIFGHHDLLPANFMADDNRLWLIDWEYAGFGTAMFDLANVAANAGLDAGMEERLLTLYFGRAPDEALRRSFAAMKVASALRETLWAMVSELHMDAPGVDYAAYGRECLEKFEAEWRAYSGAAA